MLLLLIAGCQNDEPLGVIPRDPASRSQRPVDQGLPPEDDGSTTRRSGDVANAVPRIERMELGPANANTNTDIFAKVKAVDGDGDFVRLQYQWMVNDRKILAANNDRLPSNHFKRGDKVTCTVTASDRQDKSELGGSLTIGNAPPEITTNPSQVTQVDGLRVTAKDGDGDPITWSLEGAPYGMTIHPSGGVIAYKGSSAAGDGAFTVTVVADDGEETAKWRFSAEVEAGVSAEQAALQQKLEQLEQQQKQAQAPPEPVPTFRDANDL